MAKRMSNRERIERLAAEKQAAEAEKKEAASKKKVTKKKATSSRATAASTRAAGGRHKIVWKVFNASFKEMDVFPFPEKAKAEKKAKELTEKTGHEHFVNSEEVPMED